MVRETGCVIGSCCGVAPARAADTMIGCPSSQRWWTWARSQLRLARRLPVERRDDRAPAHVTSRPEVLACLTDGWRTTPDDNLNG